VSAHPTRTAPVPVTAKLSKQLYDRLGDEVVNELVTWFNEVDTSYRDSLRELNENNFARFDAKLDQRFAEFELRIDRRFAELELKCDRGFAEMGERVERSAKEQIRWMFLVWSAMLIPIIGLWMRR
jgi:hypothetical protein